MGKMASLFGGLLRFSYHSFDRIVINSYIMSLMRECNIAYFFREVKGLPFVSKEDLSARTNAYRSWVDSYGSNLGVPIEWAVKGERKKDALAPLLQRAKRRNEFGVYAIFKSLESGPSFRIVKPKREPTNDPGWRKIARSRSRYTHYYFYIHDEVLGAFAMRIGSFFPFQATFYLNGHNLIERELLSRGIRYKMKGNLFTSVADPVALQEISDGLDPDLIRERLDHWCYVCGPKFSTAEREAMTLRRMFYLSQIEYAQNYAVNRRVALHSLFERSCDLGLMRIGPKRIAEIFGWRITRRHAGKLECVLDEFDKGHHVLRAYARNSFVKQYEKAGTHLRIETCCNNVKDFKINKEIGNLPKVAKALRASNERFAEQQAEALNVEPDVALLEELAQSTMKGARKVPGIRIDQDRVIRLLEVLMQSACAIGGLTSRELHQAVCELSGIDADTYTLNQLRYDLRKLVGHRLVERIKGSHRYLLTTKGRKVAAMMVLTRNRILRPVAGSLFGKKVNPNWKPASKLQKAYREVDRAFSTLTALMKAA